MFEYLFGNKQTERILLFLSQQERCYAAQLAKLFDTSIYGIQVILDKLEKGGLLVSFVEGRIRWYEMNPRYPFQIDILNWMKKTMTFLPDNIQAMYVPQTQRVRPRRKGKPILNGWY